MARNGSGTMSVVNTFVAGNTITAAGHNQNNTDIAAEITNSVAVDGQSVMTGQIKAANGTVSLPGITFGADLDSGLYRIGAGNIGFAVDGTKVLDFSTVQNVNMIPFQSNGLLTAALGIAVSAGVITNAVGAVAAPSFTFTGDLDCGMYRIGANNIGLAVNGAKVLDIATTGLGVTGTLASTGAISGTTITGTGAISGATAAGAMVATQAQMETGTATDTLVPIGRQHFHPLHPKAWCNFNGTGTPAITVGSGVSSITDNGVGDYTVNFTTAFSTANYGVQANAGSTAAGVGSFVTLDRNPSGVFSAPTASSFQMSTFAVGGAAHDPPRVHIAAWGDFA